MRAGGFDFPMSGQGRPTENNSWRVFSGSTGLRHGGAGVGLVVARFYEHLGLSGILRFSTIDSISLETGAKGMTCEGPGCKKENP
jgi:hypothetical protein